MVDIAIRQATSASVRLPLTSCLNRLCVHGVQRMPCLPSILLSAIIKRESRMQELAQRHAEGLSKSGHPVDRHVDFSEFDGRNIRSARLADAAETFERVAFGEPGLAQIAAENLPLH